MATGALGMIATAPEPIDFRNRLRRSAKISAFVAAVTLNGTCSLRSGERCCPLVYYYGHPAPATATSFVQIFEAFFARHSSGSRASEVSMKSVRRCGPPRAQGIGM